MVRGPSAGTVRPLSIILFRRQATYPAYAGLFVPFQNKVLPTAFHLTPPFTYKCWQVTRMLRITSQGHMRRRRPRCSCPSRSPAILLWLNSQLMAGMRWDLVGLRNSFLVTRPSYYYFVPPPLRFSGVFAPSADGVAIKACPLHCGASTSPTGKSFPHVWLNLSYLDDRMTISRRLTVDLDLVSV